MQFTLGMFAKCFEADAVFMLVCFKRGELMSRNLLLLLQLHAVSPPVGLPLSPQHSNNKRYTATYWMYSSSTAPAVFYTWPPAFYYKRIPSKRDHLITSCNTCSSCQRLLVLFRCLPCTFFCLAVLHLLCHDLPFCTNSFLSHCLHSATVLLDNLSWI